MSGIRSHLERDPRLAEAESLWPVLHDGVLEQYADAGDSVSLVIDVPHVRAHAGLPRESRFRVECSGVVEVSLVEWQLPAGAPEQAASESREVYSARCQAWRERGTFPSVARDRFAAELAREGARLDISKACIADVPATGGIVLWIGGMLRPDEEWRELVVEAHSVAILEGDRPLERPAFVALGEAYWDAWEKRGAGRAPA